MLVTRKSFLTGRETAMELDITPKQLSDYENGRGLLQNIFPNLSSSEREFIKTGITDTEWNQYIAIGEDD